ncbi:lipase secretion chaperone [Enterovibrio sp. 27052020O]|uniref:lipase secretion chaperone n=1 Tax=Enterovibrio sp. 27052020O TaxID=3241166 RepID=UPI00388FBAA2
MRISFTSYKIILLIVVGLIFAVFMHGYTVHEEEGQAQVRSHLGTDVDISSDRDTFEYFLSTLGEQDLAQVNQDYVEFADTLSFGEQQKILFEKYQVYRDALSQVAPPDSLDGIDYLHYIHHQSMALQSQHFTVDEQKRLFYEQNLTREMAIKRLALELLALDEDSYQAQWQAELDQLPPDMKESYQNAALIGQLNTIQSSNDESKTDQIRALIGEEAAQRLEIFDAQEATFNQTFQDYLVARQALLRQTFHSENEQTVALTALKATHFAAEDIRRVEALENLNDEENTAN